MAKKEIFLKKGFILVDEIKPDFELLVFKFNQNAADPKFKKTNPDKYSKGLTIIRSAQCPYSVKNVNAILNTAKKLKIEANLIEIKDSESAQQTPSAFGTFCIILNNVVICHHPISNTRFVISLSQFLLATLTILSCHFAFHSSAKFVTPALDKSCNRDNFILRRFLFIPATIILCKNF